MSTIPRSSHTVRHRRGWRVLALAALSIIAVPHSITQARDPLLRRWVGTYRGRPLMLDFYGDTMLVVNDHHALNFSYTSNTVTAFGDTNLSVQYEFSFDKLLITTAEGTMVTMSPQAVEARPLDGPRAGLGIPGRWVTDNSGQQMMLEMWKGGPARWRNVPGGSWQRGEWVRAARSVTFTWEPDSTVWEGIYDAPRALIFEQTEEGSGIRIFRRKMR